MLPVHILDSDILKNIQLLLFILPYDSWEKVFKDNLQKQAILTSLWNSLLSYFTVSNELVGHMEEYVHMKL